MSLKMICLSTTLFLLSLFPFPQGAQAQDKSTARDHRSDTTVRDHRVEAIHLTAGECEALGGKVYNPIRTSLCASGKYCGTTSSDGTRHRVCIAKTDTATTNAPQESGPQKSQQFGQLTQVNPNQLVVATPLTNEECEGLGGEVNTRKGSKCETECWTADQHGVIRAVCIDEAKGE